MEELFFFQYHLSMSKQDCFSLPVHERKWLIQRFAQQKKQENDAIEKAKKKARNG
jgi:hypothetical protein